MDERRFDDLARRMAVSPSSRRTVVKAILGLAAGALAVGRRSGTEAAVCSPGGRTCRTQANCCSGECLSADLFRDRRKRCQCDSDLPICGTRCCTGVAPACCPGDGCVDLASDPQHCGGCGVVAETDRGETCCGGVVTVLRTNANCSACGDDCADLGPEFTCQSGPSGFACMAGPPPCGPSTGTVTATCPNPTETETITATPTDTNTNTGTQTSTTTVTPTSPT